MTTTARFRTTLRSESLRKSLLICGILYPIVYVSMMFFVKWDGYSRFSQTVSELSAFDAPTRGLWMGLGAVYTVLVIAFATGVLASAGYNRRLRVAGVLILADGILGAYWPPMHLREVLAAGGGTISDTLHVAVWTPVTGLLFMGAMVFGAFAFGQRFRWYSFASMAMVMAFGILTTRATTGLDKDLPTPWLGVWERLGIVAFMTWVAVLAVSVLREQRATAGVTTHRRPVRARKLAA